MAVISSPLEFTISQTFNLINYEEETRNYCPSCNTLLNCEKNIRLLYAASSLVVSTPWIVLTNPGEDVCIDLGHTILINRLEQIYKSNNDNVEDKYITLLNMTFKYDACQHILITIQANSSTALDGIFSLVRQHQMLSYRSPLCKTQWQNLMNGINSYSSVYSNHYDMACSLPHYTIKTCTFNEWYKQHIT